MKDQTITPNFGRNFKNMISLIKLGCYHKCSLIEVLCEKQTVFVTWIRPTVIIIVCDRFLTLFSIQLRGTLLMSGK